MTTPQIPDESREALADALRKHFTEKLVASGNTDAACDAWWYAEAAVDYLVRGRADLRAAIAEEIAQAIEARYEKARAAHYRAALATAARIAREVGAKANGDPT